MDEVKSTLFQPVDQIFNNLKKLQNGTAPLQQSPLLEGEGGGEKI